MLSVCIMPNQEIPEQDKLFLQPGDENYVIDLFKGKVTDDIYPNNTKLRSLLYKNQASFKNRNQELGHQYFSDFFDCSKCLFSLLNVHTNKQSLV